MLYCIVVVLCFSALNESFLLRLSSIPGLSKSRPLCIVKLGILVFRLISDYENKLRTTIQNLYLHSVIIQHNVGWSISVPLYSGAVYLSTFTHNIIMIVLRASESPVSEFLCNPQS